MARYGGSFAIGFVVGVITLFTIGIVTVRDVRYISAGLEDTPSQHGQLKGDAKETSGTPYVNEPNKATLVVTIQTAGDRVSIERVSLDAAGWVVVHEVEEGHILNALGATRLDIGDHQNISVELLRGTMPNKEYAVVLYMDNGNKEFELRGDLPMIDKIGNPIMQSFRTYTISN